MLRVINAALRERRTPFSAGAVDITVPAAVVPYLRSGLRAEVGSALDLLAHELAVSEPDPQRWKEAFVYLDRAREQLARVGVGAGVAERDVTFRMARRDAAIVLGALHAVYDSEIERLAEAERDRVCPALRDVPALRSFIGELEKRLGRWVRGVRPLIEAAEKRTPDAVRADFQTTER